LEHLKLAGADFKISALKDLMEEVIRESGFEQEDAPNAISWEKIKRITAGFILADLEKEHIQSYVRRLSEALNHFKVCVPRSFQDC
jgi:hypothetical protein